jgi:hypothetical protein
MAEAIMRQLKGRDAMKNYVLIACLAGLAACQHLPKDERTWTRVDCSGFTNTWTECARQAHELCPKGFDQTPREWNYAMAKRTYEVACRQ